VFYDQVIKHKVTDRGNCYGMSLLSLMMLKHGGHMGYCLPIPQYSGDPSDSVPNENLGAGPTDPMLRRAINIMHCHQVNVPTLQLFLGVIGQNKNRDASFALAEFQQAQMQSDPTLVCITKDLNPSGKAHTMVAYEAKDLGGGDIGLFVYDPFRSWGEPGHRSWYLTKQNFIKITGNTWSFVMRSGNTWSGAPWTGGNIVIVPISVTGPHARSPASMGDQIIGTILNTVFVSGGDADIEQVADDAGKRLFRPGTRELDTDPSTGMMTMLPFYPSGQEAPGAPEGTAIFSLGRASNLSVTVRAGDAGYTLAVGGPRHRITVRALGGRGADVVSFREAGSVSQSLEVRNLRGSSEYDIQLIQSDPAQQQTRVLRASRAVVPGGASLTVSPDDAHRALTLSADAPIRYDLELRVTTPKGTDALTRRELRQDEGVTRTVRPGDWKYLGATELLETTVPSVRAVRGGAGRPNSGG
jgi:hypothetical protein